jgi:hypothetical protein
MGEPVFALIGFMIVNKITDNDIAELLAQKLYKNYTSEIVHKKNLGQKDYTSNEMKIVCDEYKLKADIFFNPTLK